MTTYTLCTRPSSPRPPRLQPIHPAAALPAKAKASSGSSRVQSDPADTWAPRYSLVTPAVADRATGAAAASNQGVDGSSIVSSDMGAVTASRETTAVRAGAAVQVQQPTMMFTVHHVAGGAHAGGGGGGGGGSSGSRSSSSGGSNGSSGGSSVTCSIPLTEVELDMTAEEVCGGVWCVVGVWVCCVCVCACAVLCCVLCCAVQCAVCCAHTCTVCGWVRTSWGTICLSVLLSSGVVVWWEGQAGRGGGHSAESQRVPGSVSLNIHQALTAHKYTSTQN